MNHVHIHLLITHLAILGSIVGGLVLAHWSQFAYLTGEGVLEQCPSLHFLKS